LLDLPGFFLVSPSLFIVQSPAVSGGDSFSSLGHVSEAAFGAIATVLRFLKNELEASEYGSPLRQFLIFKIKGV